MFRPMPSRFDTITVNLALAILCAELPLNERKIGGTSQIRLALRALFPHANRPDAFRDFWRACDGSKHPWLTGHEEYRAISAGLREAGFAIDEDNVPWWMRPAEWENDPNRKKRR